MNIQSEIEFFSDLGPIDQARFITRLICEIADETRIGDGGDSSRLKFAIEINQRLARFAHQVLSEDTTRPADDVVIRMLLGRRADKNAERVVHNAYRRVLTGFEGFDTTVLLTH